MDMVFLQRSLMDANTYATCDVYHATHFREDGGPVRPIAEFDADGPVGNTAACVRNIPHGHSETPLPLPAMQFGVNTAQDHDPDGPLELPCMNFDAPVKGKAERHRAAADEADPDYLPLPSLDGFFRKQAG